MKIIPVLDLKGGLVVQGRMGDRANYRPIETPLAAKPDPVAVAKGLAELAGFDTFYIADLDAIEGRRAQTAAVDALCAAFPESACWIDAGLSTAAAARMLLSRRQVVAVLGSETAESAAMVAAFSDEPRAVLSLDYRGAIFAGPPGLDETADLWPARVIAMTLAKVGSGAGPDFDGVENIIRLARGRQVFAAGGVRHEGDLARLADLGVAGVLVASALHNGRLDGAALARWNG